MKSKLYPISASGYNHKYIWNEYFKYNWNIIFRCRYKKSINSLKLSIWCNFIHIGFFILFFSIYIYWYSNINSILFPQTKNNKNSSVSIDGITAIQGNSKKLPSFTLKFKGKEYKDVNKAAKNEKFEFGITPAELKGELVTFDKVKTGKDGTVQIKQITFKPEATVSGGSAPKPLKLKYKKRESKTDFVTKVNPDGSLTITGKNNYYGNVAYK